MPGPPPGERFKSALPSTLFDEQVAAHNAFLSERRLLEATGCQTPDQLQRIISDATRFADLHGNSTEATEYHNSFNDHYDLSNESGWHNMVMKMMSTMCNDTGQALTVLACVSSYLPHSLGLSSFTASPS